MAAFKAPGAAGRVLEIRNYINEFAVRGSGKNFIQFFRNQAAVIGRNFYKFRLVSIESVQCAEVGRTFAQNNIAGVKEQFACKIKALLAAGGNKNIVRVNFGMVFIFHAFGNFSAQGRAAFGSCVLQQLTAFFFYQVMGNFGNFFNREQFRCGQAACKRDNIRLCGKF